MRSKLTALAANAAITTGCSRERIVQLGWDRPAVVPDRCRVFLDDRNVKDVPPPLNPACHCLTVAVSVSRGPHTIQVVTYNVRGGISPPATLTVQRAR